MAAAVWHGRPPFPPFLVLHPIILPTPAKTLSRPHLFPKPRPATLPLATPPELHHPIGLLPWNAPDPTHTQPVPTLPLLVPTPPPPGSHAWDSEEEQQGSRSESPRIPSIALVTCWRTRGGQATNITWQAMPQQVVKDLMKALKEYGWDSPYFQGLLNAQLAGTVAVPFDLKHLFRCLYSRAEYQLWEATWRDLLRDALPGMLANPNTAEDIHKNKITMLDLIGEGDWEIPAKQASDIPRPVLEKGTSVAEKAFLDMRPSGPLQYYLGIFQGPSEHYLKFVKRLTAAVEQQVDEDIARKSVVRSLAFTHANDVCKRAMLTLPKKPKLTLQDYMQVVTEEVPMMTPGRPEKKDPHHRTVATATETIKALPATQTPCTPGPTMRPSRGPADKPCMLCGKRGHW
ncbi:hypothetical protein HGM15179_015037 [Zosterops borbonicus]|uniref:Retroviral nucleocapsid Gag protein p24 C-terminal domain-containing protein n=1 Tax=Zosterops borbonicus TaxID=364589 RepID=A0A8K1G5P7_9PASS|nr:hypothetical protein HGM15179_015037 [Zosterops borbonicus]